MPTTPIIVKSSLELGLKFLPVETPHDLLPDFVVDSISIPILTTSMLGVTTVSTPMVLIPALMIE
jgi:hypothetical protein